MTTPTPAETTPEPRPARCKASCPPDHAEHLAHMTDGRWHDNCGYCLERRAHGGTGLETAHQAATAPEPRTA